MDNTLSPVHEEVLRKEIEILRRKLKNVHSSKGRLSVPEPYLAMLDDLPDLLCLFGRDGTISYANSSFCRYFCKNRFEPMGNSVFTYIPRKDRKRFARSIEKLTALKPSRGFEYRLEGIAGDSHWHQWTLKALLNGSNLPVEYLLAGRDITSLKSMEEDLIDALEKYATLFESTRDAIVIHDTERFIDCNTAALSMFRLDDKDCFLHSTFLHFLLPGLTDRKPPSNELQRHFDKAYRHGMERFQCMCRRADGSAFQADILMSPFPLGTRNVLSSVIRDISALKSAEESLINTCSSLEEIISDRNRELRLKDRRLAQEVQKRKKLEHHLKITEEKFKQASGQIRELR
jgi:PAS domain S-box-containing protein